MTMLEETEVDVIVLLVELSTLMQTYMFSSRYTYDDPEAGF